MIPRVVSPTIGADVELFLMHRSTKEIISAEGYVKGTKNVPFNFDASNKYFATSLDNVLAEYCIPPVTDKAKFKEYLQKGKEYIEKTIPDTFCTVSLPSAILDAKWLQTENAKLFGCEPDYCVWIRDINPKPIAENQNLRSAGGHIHIGYKDVTMETSEELVKAMDLFVGVPSVLQEPDNDRKRLYGKAGCFRFKDYGVEYRTISNYYVGDDRLTDWVFEAIEKAIGAVNDGMDFDQYKDRIIDAIDNNNKLTPNTLIKELDLQLA